MSKLHCLTEQREVGHLAGYPHEPRRPDNPAVSFLHGALLVIRYNNNNRPRYCDSSGEEPPMCIRVCKEEGIGRMLLPTLWIEIQINEQAVFFFIILHLDSLENLQIYEEQSWDYQVAILWSNKTVSSMWTSCC